MKVSSADSSKGLSGSSQINVSFARTSLRVTESPFGALFDLEDCQLAGEFGGPALPAKTIRVAMPVGADAVSVSYEVLEKVVVSEQPLVPAPLQPPRPGPSRKDSDPCKPEDDPDQENPERIRQILERLKEEPTAPPIPPPAFVPPKPELYARELEEPRPVAKLLKTEQMGANRVANIQINPLQWDKRGRVELCTEIKIEVIFGSETTPRNGSTAEQLDIASRAQAERLTELTRSVVVNPLAVIDLSKWWAAVITNVEYLIITDNFRWDAATITRGDALSGDVVAQFRRLAAWKQRRGLRTHVATISQIVSGSYGNFRSGARDLQEVIRNFLKFAHSNWGVAWVVLGGDIEMLPVREVVGYADGWLGVTGTNPPEVNNTFWTGTFVKLRSPGHTSANPLLNAQNGLHIPYDAAGTSGPGQRGWYFTTDENYTTRTTMATEFIRVNGPAWEINSPLQWVGYSNTIPTDLYYASLTGAQYGLPGQHDWDRVGNGFYGTHNDGADMDGVNYRADVSVGRIPVINAAQAEAFVNKLIAYESFRRPDGRLLDVNWPRKFLIGSANWGGRIAIWPGGPNPPGNHQAFRPPGGNYCLLNTQDPLTVSDWRLLIEVTPTDIRVSPYNPAASPTSRGWHFARSGSDLSVSEFAFTLPFGLTFRVPIPTKWVVVRGPAAELSAGVFVFDHAQPDGSLLDQEILRVQMAADFPAVNNIYRLYEDEIDLTPAQRVAAPVEHLTEPRMLAKLNEGQHFLSLSGHGWWGGCCGYGLNAAQNATNGLHTYIAFADSCSTNEFNVDDAVSELSLCNPNGGAVAYVGNSRYSWIGVGDNFQRAFFHRLATTRHLGLLADTRCTMINEPGHWVRYNKWVNFAQNLMGDPEMPVWVGPPRTAVARYLRELDKRVPFEVQVFQTAFPGLELPLPGAVVTISQGTFYRQATTDFLGRVQFDIRNTTLGTIDLTVTKIDYLPIVGIAEVTGPVWVKGKVNLISHQHLAPDASYVRLELTTAINGDGVRGWYARTSKPDYQIILDAVTDAYVTQNEIYLYVVSIKDGGTIEKFRFGEIRVLSELVPITTITERFAPTLMQTSAREEIEAPVETGEVLLNRMGRVPQEEEVFARGAKPVAEEKAGI